MALKSFFFRIEKRYPLYLIVLGFFLLTMLISAISVLLEVSFSFELPESGNEAKISKTLIRDLITTAIIVPLIETLFFQHYALKLFRYCFGRRDYTNILCTGTLFGLLHFPYEGLGLISHTLTAYILAYIYIIAWNRNRNPFWPTCLVHMLHNLTVVLGSQLG
jgi:membrane protease YdiL (CAAX protease family)